MIKQNGNVGIGTTGPGARFAVESGAGSNFVFSATIATEGTLIGQISGAEGAVRFYTAGGGDFSNVAATVINLNKNSSTGRSINAYGTINASGADYAEYFYQAVPGSLEKGEVVCLAPEDQTVTACDATNNNLVGVVSTNPGYVGNDIYDVNYPDRTVAVGLVVQLPVKVASTSAAIRVGDYLVSSGDRGRAVKAISRGWVMGKALESWAPGVGKDTVLVFINQSWWGGETEMVLAKLDSIPEDISSKLAEISQIKSDIDLLKDQMASV